MVNEKITRQELIELLYEQKEAHKEYEPVLNELLESKITVDEAVDKAIKIEEEINSLSFLPAIMDKPLFKNIRRFVNEELDDLETMKMLSSILTQLFIHKQKNKDYIVNIDIHKSIEQCIDTYITKQEIDRPKIIRILNDLGYDKLNKN